MHNAQAHKNKQKKNDRHHAWHSAKQQKGATKEDPMVSMSGW
jgi:hypothetical protein